MKSKKSYIAKISSIFLAVCYGIFIVLYVNRHFTLGSGDIGSLVRNFEKLGDLNGLSDNFLITLNPLFSGDLIFRFLILYLQEIFNQNSLVILRAIAFMTSSLTFFVYCINIRLNKSFILVFILLILVFTTPRVANLFASGVRSGIAFVMLFISMMYLRGISQYILFLLSTLLHASMAPMILFYFLFCWLENRKLKFSFYLKLLILIICAWLLVFFTPKFSFAYRGTGVSQSFLYMLLIIFIGTSIIFTNKKAIENVYGFISISLIFIIIFGFIFDFSFIRYIGNAILLYSMYLVTEGTTRSIKFFIILYIPFFSLTLFYSISNYW